MSYDPSEPRNKYGEWTSGGNGGPRDVATYTAFPTQNVHDTGYLYHGTNINNLRDIAESGRLETHLPNYGTWGQDVWPDGSKQKRAYFASNPTVVSAFFPEEGRPVVVRVKATSDIKREAYTGDFYSTKPIPAREIEYLANDGNWYPLTPGKPVRIARGTAKHPVDRFPGIGGGATGRHK